MKLTQSFLTVDLFQSVNINILSTEAPPSPIFSFPKELFLVFSLYYKHFIQLFPQQHERTAEKLQS